VNPSSIGGNVFAKEDLPVCDYDHCDDSRDSWRCFTGQKYEMKSAFLAGDRNVVASSDVGKEEDCLKFCAPYYAAKYSAYAEGDSCYCLDKSEFCLAEWGDRVNPAKVAYGWWYTKENTDPCDYEFCDWNPYDWLCFTGNEYDMKDYVPYSFSEEEDNAADLEQDVDNAKECLQLCQFHDRIIYRVRYDAWLGLPRGGTCACYWGEPNCLVSTEGADQSHIATGSIYVKISNLPLCDFTMCELTPDAVFCR
jgi:hypothetical protein